MKILRYILIQMFLVVLLISTCKAFSQNYDSIIHICKYPVTKGYVYLLKYDNTSTYIEPLRYVPIFSNDSSVFATEAGNVVIVHKEKNFESICIETKEKKYFTYTNLQKSMVNVGDKITQGLLLGFARKHSTNEYFMFNFKINYGEKDITYEDHIKYILNICTPN